MSSSPESTRTVQSATRQPRPPLPTSKRAGPQSPGGSADGDRNGGNKRIKTVTQACKQCRRNKAKCDGTRPKCGSCVLKNRECGYEGEVGQSRQEALKARLESLEKLFDTLQKRSPEDAERLLRRIREADGLTSVASLNGSDDDEPADGGAVQPSSSSWALTARDRGAYPPPPPPSSSSGASRVRSDSDVQELLSRQSAMAASLSSRSATMSVGGRSMADTSTLLVRLIMPNLALTTRAIESFFASTGQLFHVFTRDQIAVFLEDVFGSSRSAINAKKAVCCMACVAAVGVQYTADNFEPGLDEVFYDVARHYFIDVFEDSPLDAIKVCTLLAMFNIMNKATVSVAYVEVGLGMSRRHSLNDRTYVFPGLTEAQWLDYRRSWRCLIFFSTWLSSTLGYISSEDVPFKSLMHAAQAEAGNSADIIDTVQMEMTKISMLKADILRMHLAFKDLTAHVLESVVNDLQNWYNHLPEGMKLATLGQDLPDSVRRSIYYVHLLHLGAIMLLYRRVACQYIRSFGMDPQHDMFWKPFERQMLDHAEQGVLAAKTSSRVLGLLLGQTGCFKRCWVVIFQSYTSAVVLLHCVAQKQVHQMPPSSWEEDLPQVKTCLDALEYCGTLDPVALKFHERLMHVYQTLCMHRVNRGARPLSPPYSSSPEMDVSASTANTGNVPAKTSTSLIPSSSRFCAPSHPFAFLLTVPKHGDPAAIELSTELLKRLSRPYDNPDENELHLSSSPEKPCSGLQPAFCGVVGSQGNIAQKVEWDLENARSCRWEPVDLCIPKEFGGDVVLGGTKFLGSMSPSGWTTAI